MAWNCCVFESDAGKLGGFGMVPLRKTRQTIKANYTDFQSRTAQKHTGKYSKRNRISRPAEAAVLMPKRSSVPLSRALK